MRFVQPVRPQRGIAASLREVPDAFLMTDEAGVIQSPAALSSTWRS